MIRLYKDDGTKEVVENCGLLEIASTDGKPAVFILEGVDGSLEVLKREDPKFATICARLGLEPADIQISIL